MTEKDVMVGDWFRFRYTTISNREVVHTFRISQIENQLGQYYVWGDGFGRMCHPENLEPIPLTQEILEKNGFTKSERYEVWKIIRDDYELRVTPWRVAVIFLEDGADKEEYSMPRPKCVHELQHFLKLAKLEKDITL